MRALPFQIFSLIHFENSDSNHTDTRRTTNNRRRVKAFPVGGPRRRDHIVEQDTVPGYYSGIPSKVGIFGGVINGCCQWCGISYIIEERQRDGTNAKQPQYTYRQPDVAIRGKD